MHVKQEWTCKGSSGEVTFLLMFRTSVISSVFPQNHGFKEVAMTSAEPNCGLRESHTQRGSGPQRQHVLQDKEFTGPHWIEQAPQRPPLAVTTITMYDKVRL